MIAGTVSTRLGRPKVRVGIAIAAGSAAAAVVLLGPAATDLGPSLADRLILALAATAMAIVVAIAVLEPWLGLLAWIVCMPVLNIARVRLDTAPVAATATTIVVTALIVGAVLEARAIDRPPRPVPLKRAWIAALALIGITVLSALVHGTPETTWPVALHGVIEPVVLVMVALELRPDERRLWQLVGALVGSASIAAAYSLYRLGKTAALSGVDQVLRGDFGHYVYYNVNIFGEILGMTVPLAIGLYLLMRRRGTVRVAPFAVTLLLVVALYFTYSKGAWLGGLFGATLVVTLAAGRLWQRALSIVTAGLVALLIVPVPLYVGAWLATNSAALPTPSGSPTGIASPPPDGGAYQQLLGVIQGSDRLSSWDPTSATGEISVRERYLAWRAAVEMAVSSPLVGVGPGRFGEEVIGPFKQPGSTRPLNSAHNYVLNVAAELGVVAAAILSMALLAAAWLTFRTWRRGTGTTRSLGLAVGGSLLAFIVIGATTGADLYEAYRVMNADAIFLALVVAIGLGLGQLRPEPEAGPTSAA